jgi:hypothetical protein
MRYSTRYTILVCLFLFCIPVSSLGQLKDDGAAAIMAGAAPGYARAAPNAVNLAQTTQLQPISSSTILVFPANAATSREVFNVGNLAGAQNTGAAGAKPNTAAEGSDGDEHFDDVRKSPPGGTVTGLDTVPTFQGAFFHNRLFNFTMMGQHPLAGGTTVIPAKITEFSLTLLNADGSVNVQVPFASFEDLTLDSPNFEEANYRSGRGIQFADAIQRAEFFHTMGDDWHTVLRPRVVNRVTLTIPRFVNVQFPDGSVKAIQAYRVGTAADGNHFVLLLDLLFNFLSFNQAVNDINAGNYTTNALNTALFPNTFLFSIDNMGKVSNCCVLGFHTYILDPTVDPQPRWIYEFASWISPGLFGGGTQDVTALSHETSEAFNDPFVNNATPVWQFPGVPANAKICQGNLETGDPVEVLGKTTVAITIKERHEVFTYHPQTEALLQWFEMGAKSNAIDGAFSFPDETALPHSALPCPQ